MSSDPGKMELVTKTVFSVCGISCRTSNSRAKEIGALWQRYFQENVRDQVHGRVSDAIFAVYSEYENDHTGEYTLVVGHEVPDGSKSPTGLVTKRLPAATYQRIEARGEQPASVIAAWQQVWNSGLSRTYVADFEQYLSVDLVQVHVAVEPV